MNMRRSDLSALHLDWDGSEEFPEFRDFVANVESVTDPAVWYVYDFEFVSRNPSSLTERVDRATSGLLMSSDEIRLFSSSILQTVDCIVLALVRRPSDAEHHQLDSGDFKACPFHAAIYAYRARAWAIVGSDRIIRSARQEFPSAKLVDIDSVLGEGWAPTAT